MFCARHGIKAGSYTAPQPHLRARPKVFALDNARDETASDMCESSATSKSHGRVCKLIYLVLSSSIEDTVRVVDETDARGRSFLLPDPLPMKPTPKTHSRLSGPVLDRVIVVC